MRGFLVKKECMMSITIEHDAHIVWDINEIFPGRTIADAFLEAGGVVVGRDDCEIMVACLSFKCVKKLCHDWGADYIGPVFTNQEPPEYLKDVTPKTGALTLA